MTTSVPRLRALAVLRGVYGLVLLLRTREVLVRVHGVRAEPVELLVMRVLGARHVAQAVLTAAVPTPPVVLAGEAADVLHGATGVALAAVSSQRRRAGLVELGVASAFAGATALVD